MNTQTVRITFVNLKYAIKLKELDFTLDSIAVCKKIGPSPLEIKFQPYRKCKIFFSETFLLSFNNLDMANCIEWMSEMFNQYFHLDYNKDKC